MPKAVVGERADHPAHFAITHRHKRAIALIGCEPRYPASACPISLFRSQARTSVAPALRQTARGEL
jgi:hypothetical protein